MSVPVPRRSIESANYDERIKEALSIKSIMDEPLPPPKEKSEIIIPDSMKASMFIYPTLIIIPLVITTVIILTLHISVLLKIFIIVLLVISMGAYISQIKSLDIANTLNNINNYLPAKKN